MSERNKNYLVFFIFYCCIFFTFPFPAISDNVNFLSLKNNDKKDTIKKINNESVIPNNEFSIIYGENRKKHAPTIAISCLKNFLARKYIGITDNTEKIIEHILCSVI